MAIKTSKSTNFPTVNQFDVDSTLAGLIEKFHVLNRDDLANGLDSRLKKLNPLSNRWTPDILFLLLQLSDQPVKKSPDFDEHQQRAASPQVQGLTLADLLVDDPYSDDELWQEASYSTLSSDLDEVEDERAHPRDGSEQGADSNEPRLASGKPVFLSSSTLREQDAALADLEKLQLWPDSSRTEKNGPHVMSEVIVIRESLLMLHGLPSPLFRTTVQNEIEYCSTNATQDLSSPAIASVLQTLARIGSPIKKLRRWCEAEHPGALLQRFQCVVECRLTDFDKSIVQLEERCTAPVESHVVSLVAVCDEVRARSRPILALANIAAGLSKQDVEQFSHLEPLYDDVCDYQASGDDEIYNYLADVFLQSLETYLRPIRAWMEHGELHTSDNFFFIAEQPSAGESIWHDWYALRKNPDGRLSAPKFIFAASKRILNAGKSIKFLSQLGLLNVGLTFEEPPLDFKSLSVEQGITPFSVLFEQRFLEWINSKYKPTSRILKEQLVDVHGLCKCLRALQDIYIFRNGAQLQNFADPIFATLDRKGGSWSDRFVLAEHARNVFQACKDVDVNRLSIRSVSAKSASKSLRGLSAFVIDYSVSHPSLLPCLTAKISWPLLNVIRKSSLQMYQALFKFLLQIYRAKSDLRKIALLRDAAQEHPLAVALRLESNWFVDTLLTYVVDIVLVPCSKDLFERIQRAEDVDEMTQIHDEFISNTHARCLLSKNLGPIQNAILSALDIAVQFADHQLHQAGRRARGRNQKKTAVTARRSPKAATIYVADESTDEGGDTDDGDYDADTENLSGPVVSHADKLKAMRDELSRLRIFAVKGLRGISRSGGEFAWEILADHLDLGRHV